MFQIVYAGQDMRLTDTDLSGEMLEKILLKVRLGEYFWLTVGEVEPMKLLLGPGIPFAVRDLGGSGTSLTVTDATISEFLGDDGRPESQ